MKSSDNFKSSLKSIDRKWHEFNLHLGIVCRNIEGMQKDELEYDAIKKLFSLLEAKSRHLSQIELLKEKYSEFFEKYQQEKREEKKRFKQYLQKVMNDDTTSLEEKYDLLGERELEQNDAEINQDTLDPELLKWQKYSSLKENYEEQIKLMEVWIDKQDFGTIDTNFLEFKDELEIRRVINTAIIKYADIFIDSSRKVLHKYSMLKYFNSLCKLRDRVNRKKVMPVA